MVQAISRHRIAIRPNCSLLGEGLGHSRFYIGLRSRQSNVTCAPVTRQLRRKVQYDKMADYPPDTHYIKWLTHEQWDLIAAVKLVVLG
jgi:hypothetical protein